MYLVRSILPNLNNRYKLFAYVFLISMLGLLVTSLRGDLTQTILLSAAIGLILLIARPIWFPDRYGETAVRLLSLGVAGSAVAAFVGWPALLDKYLAPILKTHLPTLEIQNSDGLEITVFVFLAFVIYVVNNFRADQTSMGVHPNPIDTDIPEPSFNERVKGVCDSLTDDLRSIDINTNWSASYFTPLDAEVEISTSKGKERKVTDLLNAIRGSKDRLFLVLGDPGSGKSVALRKLCQDLASEVEKTGKIPIYLNLREWHLEEKWTEENQPTVQQLYDFAFDKVKERDISTGKFFKKYFDRLYDTGHLYFVLDSFDEIPAILAEPDGSELIKQVSDVIFRFLKGGRQVGSQGILASRIFRKPTQEFQTKVTLELRPFTEEKIISTFKNHDIFSENIIKELFRDRPELVPIARNPLSTTLIAEYIENNDNKLPKNQSDMYADYFSRTLDSCNDRIIKRKLTKDQVIEYTVEIANIMFSKHGLEAPLIKIIDELTTIPVEDIIDILVFSRIGRIGNGDNSLFSFSHRRFIEYFSVQKMISDGHQIDLEAIPSDSQWRDTLVLYCEVASEEEITPIADYCWNLIRSSDNMQNMRVIHCMRFLADAFKGRTECITHFSDELADYIYTQIDQNNNILSVKIALETVALLKEKDRDSCICKVLSIGNPTLNNSAINSFRNLAKISKNLKAYINLLIIKKNVFSLLSERRSLLFSLSLSDALKSIKYKVKILIFFTCLWFILVTINSVASLGFFTLLVILLPIRKIENDNSDSILVIISFTSLIYLTTLMQESNPNLKPELILDSIGFFKYSILQLSNDTKKYLYLAFLLVNILILLKAAFFYDMVVGTIISIKNSYLKFLGSILFIALLLALFLLVFSKYYLGIDFIYFLYFMILITLIKTAGNTYEYLLSTLDYINGKKNLNKIKMNDRPYIYSLLMNNRSKKFKQLILSHLEENTVNMKGEWPNPDILAAGNTDEIFIRLAALEEKWLGLDR